jgi:hypothetical protein
MSAAPDLEPVELAERLLYLPDESEVEMLSDRGLGEILSQLITEAVAAGEIPEQADVQMVSLTVISVFFGVALILGPTAPEAIASMYRHQLALVWAGVRALGVPTATRPETAHSGKTN